jgi:hypothetical protein
MGRPRLPPVPFLRPAIGVTAWNCSATGSRAEAAMMEASNSSRITAALMWRRFGLSIQ